MTHPHQAFGLTETTQRLILNKGIYHATPTTMANYGFRVQHPKFKTYRQDFLMITAHKGTDFQQIRDKFGAELMVRYVSRPRLGRGCQRSA